ncbi:MAG: PPC domain-containing protein, partial [Bacteroidota bacterium]
MKQLLTLMALLMLCIGASFGQSTCQSAPNIASNQTYRSNNIGNSNTGANYTDNYRTSTYQSCYNGNSAFTGRDRLYKVQVPAGNNLSVRIWDLSADLDLFIFRSCSGATPTNCLAASLSSGTSSEEVTVQNASGTYYIVVDGYNAAQLSNFLIRATLTPSTGGSTGICGGTNNPQIVQYVTQALECGSQVQASNHNTGNTYTTYDCFNGSFVGNDVFFEVSFPQTTNATINLSGLSADLDLFLIRCVNGVTDCLAASTGPNNSNERITVNNALGNFYIIVDAQYASSVSSFVLDIDCGNTTYACSDAEHLECGGTYNRTNIGGTSHFDYNDLGACANGISQSSNPFTGADNLYRLDVPTGSNLTINMTGLGADLDMFLFEECLTYTNSPANLNNCLARSINDG